MARPHATGLAALVLAGLLLASRLPGATAALSDEDALLALKASFSNGEAVLPSWQRGTDVCAWKGVSCDAARSVAILELVGLGLVGTTPQPGGWVLPSRLQELYMAENPNITGPISPGWRLPDTLTTLYAPGTPFGGTLSPDWVLPESLKFLNLGRCGFSGTLPEGWLLPSNITGIVLPNNSFTGTIPSSFSTLPNLQLLDVASNQLTGGLPTMQFGDYQYMGVNVAGNNLSGPIPSWPDYPRAQLAVFPGNPGLCGEVPAIPTVVASSNDNTQVEPVTELPPCPGQEGAGASSGGTNTGAIVGGVVGGLAAVTLALVGAAWYSRRRRQQRAGADSEKGGWDGKLGGSAKTGSSGSQTPAPFNPFAAGPTRFSKQQVASSGTDAPSLSPSASGSVSTLPLSAAASLLAASASDNGSGGPSEDSGGLSAKLEALRKQQPSWLISAARLVLEQRPDGRLVLLGRGSYGHVYRGWLQPEANSDSNSNSSATTPEEAANGDVLASSGGAVNGTAPPAPSSTQSVPVAVKVMNSGDINSFLKEAAMMQRLANAPQVVTWHGACVVDQQLVVVMELLEGGDLRAALSGDAADSLSWRRHGKQVAVDIAAGIAYLHSHNVMHRDLKSKNVLLTVLRAPELRAKVGDVGAAALHSVTLMSAGSSMFGGTLAWAAPELLMAAPCTNKIDVYSLGVVLWELVTREVPRRGFVSPPPPSDDCPAGLSQLIADCLQQDPSRRPTAQQALERLQAL